jgi:c-di-GMP-binding flagellar brake protein YcgR
MENEPETARPARDYIMQTKDEKRLEPDSAGADHSKYLIRSRLEINAILETLRRSASLVTAYFGADNDFILTSVVALRPQENTVLVDYGADAAANRRALQAEGLTFVAEHARIKIQFAAGRLRPARLGGREVLSLALPAALLRLQRREYFRIATPLTRPLVCLIAPQAAKPRETVEATIVDISCGGIAVLEPGAPARFDTGARWRGCRIFLPELGEVSADIAVKSLFEITLRNGARQKRAGCEFVDMRERERALIQRYISRLERARKDRAGAR